MTLRRFLLSLVLTTLVVVFCVYFVDIPIAHLGMAAGSKLADAPHIPDLLGMFALAATLASWLGYSVARRLGWALRHQHYFLVNGLAIPVAYAGKTLAKLMFARIETRAWLLHPGNYEFRWFDPGSDFNGFPSGHMAVFAPMAFALYHYYPRYRWLWAGGLVVLAVALVVTDYHFVSDVVAGAYLGAVAFIVCERTVSLAHSRIGRENA